MKASNYWKNQADELLGKKKDQTPKNKIQKNNTNTEENDADVLDDSVLDVDSNFFAIDRQANEQKKQPTYPSIGTWVKTTYGEFDGLYCVKDVDAVVILKVVNLVSADLSNTIFSNRSGRIKMFYKHFGSHSIVIEEVTKIKEYFLTLTLMYKVVFSLDELENDDRALLIVNDIPNDDESDAVGLNSGRICVVEKDTISDKSFNHVCFHEICHSFSLEHRPKESSDGLMTAHITNSFALSEKKIGRIALTLSKGFFSKDGYHEFKNYPQHAKYEALSFIQKNNIKY